MIRTLWQRKGFRLCVYVSLFYGVIFAVSGLIMGGDSGMYLKWAERISQGDFGFMPSMPLHWLYSAFLSIGYLMMPEHIMTFATVFNALVLIALPYLFYRVCLMTTGLSKLSYWAGIAVMFQIYFIFC